MLKIWGRDTAINVQKVLWGCGELGLEYDRVDAGLQFGVVDQPFYLTMNPNGRVPTIEDDGFVLWESNSILRYLASKYGPRNGNNRLYPSDLQARAVVEQWMDWQLFTLWPAVVAIFLGLHRPPPGGVSAESIQGHVGRAHQAWRIVEKRLDGRDYITGKDFTLADICVGMWLYRWFEMDIRRESLPGLEAYYQRLQQREPFRTHVMQPFK
jgi:glutathione S-transferase